MPRRSGMIRSQTESTGIVSPDPDHPIPQAPPTERSVPADLGSDVAVVYEQLRQIARTLMARERPGQTLQATALVHEALLRLTGGKSSSPVPDRGHFVMTAAEVMRHVLVDRARAKTSGKRGGDVEREDWDRVEIPVTHDFSIEHMELVDRAVSRLEEHNPRWAAIVQLRYFVGMSIEETAQQLGVAVTTVKDDWRFCRAWLRAEVSKLMGVK